MSGDYKRWQSRREWKRRLSTLFGENSRTLYLHYACALYDEGVNGVPTPITAISVYDEYHGQVKSFSIHRSLVSQTKRPSAGALGLSDADLIEAEKALLRQFTNWVKSHPDHTWVHWDMRDAKYGFDVLFDRYRYLGVQAPKMPDGNRLNLKRPIREIYGRDYAPHPRLINLAKMNNIVTTDALEGKCEGSCYRDHKFKDAADSSQRKVRIMREVALLSSDGVLKTSTKWYHAPMVAVAGATDWFLDHLVFKLMTIILAIWGIVDLLLRAYAKLP